MVKGISRQVIVVHSPDQRMFEQAIFILKEGAVGQEGVTDEALLQEAKRLIRTGDRQKQSMFSYGPMWACGGAVVTGLAWLLCALL